MQLNHSEETINLPQNGAVRRVVEDFDRQRLVTEHEAAGGVTAKKEWLPRFLFSSSSRHKKSNRIQRQDGRNEAGGTTRRRRRFYFDDVFLSVCRGWWGWTKRTQRLAVGTNGSRDPGTTAYRIVLPNGWPTTTTSSRPASVGMAS
jgi:hypothetical protein